jgi:hypothetical protein
MPIIPNILNGYSLTSHLHNQYALTSSLLGYSLTSHTHNGYATTGSLTGYSLTNHTHSNYSQTNHTHTFINNNLGIYGTLSLTGGLIVKDNSNNSIITANAGDINMRTTSGIYLDTNYFASSASINEFDGGIFLDSDGFRQIKFNADEQTLEIQSADGAEINIKSTITKISDIDNNNKNIVISKSNNNDSCIYFGINKFRIRYDSVNEGLKAEAYYNGIWNESALLGEI